VGGGGGGRKKEGGKRGGGGGGEGESLGTRLHTLHPYSLEIGGPINDSSVFKQVHSDGSHDADCKWHNNPQPTHQEEDSVEWEGDAWEREYAVHVANSWLNCSVKGSVCLPVI